MNRFFFVLFSIAVPGLASTCSILPGAISCTGTLATPEDIFTETFTIGASAPITIQTYGFGGGLNAAGAAIPAGGFDPLIALFSGAATSATVLEVAGNPVASADNFSIYSPGCPPAGTVTVGSVTGVCGDDTLTAMLGPGNYTLLLTDAAFIPLAVNPNLVLGPYDLTDTTSGNYGGTNGAYNDLSGGVFQTCVDPADCNTDSGNFAVDVTGLPVSATPEPNTLAFTFLAMGLAFIAGRKRQRR